MKISAGTVLALVLIVTVGKQEKDIALLLGIGTCIMVGIAALKLLQPVLDFLYRLERIGELGENGFKNLLTSVGIGILSEFISSLCADAGNSSLGKQVQFLSAVLILSLSLPLLETFLDLLQRIMEKS